MKRIISKEEQSKKQRRNQLVIGIILIGLMFVSVGGYAFYGQEGSSNTVKKIKYNNYELNFQNGYWALNLGSYNFGFKNSPYSTSAQIEGNIKELDNYANKPLYFYSKDSEAMQQISMNLQQIVQRIQPACLENSSCIEEFPELPIKSCEDNVIIILQSNLSLIKQENNCVYIEGKQEDISNVTDEFLYNTIGVK